MWYKITDNGDVFVFVYAGLLGLYLMSDSDFKYPCGTGSVCPRKEMSILWLMFLLTFCCLSTTQKPHTEIVRLR